MNNCRTFEYYGAAGGSKSPGIINVHFPDLRFWSFAVLLMVAWKCPVPVTFVSEYHAVDILIDVWIYRIWDLKLLSHSQ